MNAPPLFAAPPPPSGFNGAPVYHPQGYGQPTGPAPANQAFTHHNGGGDSQQPFPTAGGGSGGGGGGGGRAASSSGEGSGGVMPQPQAKAAFHLPGNLYVSAHSTHPTHSNPVPAQASAFAGTQQQATAAPQIASPPPPRTSPNAVAQGSHTSSHTPPTKYPMAAPPLPHTPQPNQQSGASHDGSPAVGTPKTPLTPGSQSNREAARVALLLRINEELLEEVQRLHDAGKGGAISPQQSQQFRNENKPDNMASEEYIQCLRRIQANFAYLMPKAQNASGQTTGNENKQQQFPGPTHMLPPPHMESLKEKYEQLRELFPGWMGMDGRMAAHQQGSSASPKPGSQPGQNGFNAPPGSTASTSTTPTA